MVSSCKEVGKKEEKQKENIDSDQKNNMVKTIF